MQDNRPCTCPDWIASHQSWCPLADERDAAPADMPEGWFRPDGSPWATVREQVDAIHAAAARKRSEDDRTFEAVLPPRALLELITSREPWYVTYRAAGRSPACSVPAKVVGVSVAGRTVSVAGRRPVRYERVTAFYRRAAVATCRDCEHAHDEHDEFGACLVSSCGCMGWSS